MLAATGLNPNIVWHAETSLPKVDLVLVPGGFSYGDYLRSGAMAAVSPIMREVKAHAERGGLVLGICNGFQVLTEAGLLDGVLLRNQNLKFICKNVNLLVENTARKIRLSEFRLPTMMVIILRTIKPLKPSKITSK